MAFRTLVLQFWNYLLFQIRVNSFSSPVRTVNHHNRGLTAIQMYYQLNTKAEISQNKGPLFRRVSDTTYSLCATFTAQFAAVYHMISGTQPLTDQVWESSVLGKWKMSKMLMKERPRHNNANWHITCRKRPQSPASKSTKYKILPNHGGVSAVTVHWYASTIVQCHLQSVCNW